MTRRTRRRLAAARRFDPIDDAGVRIRNAGPSIRARQRRGAGYRTSCGVSPPLTRTRPGAAPRIL